MPFSRQVPFGPRPAAHPTPEVPAFAPAVQPAPERPRLLRRLRPYAYGAAAALASSEAIRVLT